MWRHHAVIEISRTRLCGRRSELQMTHHFHGPADKTLLLLLSKIIKSRYTASRYLRRPRPPHPAAAAKTAASAAASACIHNRLIS